MVHGIIQNSILLSIGLANLFIAFFILLQSPRSYVNRSLFVFVLGIGVWISGLGLMFLTKDFIFNQQVFYGGVLVFGGALMFAKTFPNGRRPHSAFLTLLLPLVITAMLIPFDLFVADMATDPAGNLIPVNGPLMVPYALLMLGYVLYSFFLLIKSYRTAEGITKQQLRYFFLSLTIFLGTVIITDAILPSFGVYRFNIAGPVSSMVFAGLAAYAIGLEKEGLYEKIQRHSEELETRVWQRTSELARLQESQRQMMVDISHGLQTPLTVVRGGLDLLSKQLQDNKKTAALIKSIDQVSSFIYNLLNLARLEATKEDFLKEQIDFSELINGLVEYCQVIAEEKNIKIIGRVEPGINILGKRDKLEELVINLVSNAIKYMRPDGERAIFINLHKRENTAELIVQDTGIGVSAEELPHLFEAFYRSKNNHNREISGAGLGLTISKKIAEKHSATIGVDSELGRGTTFTIKF